MSFLSPPIRLSFPASHAVVIPMEFPSISLDIRHFSVPFKQNPSFYLSPSPPYLLPFRQAVSPNPTFIKLRMDCHLFHVGGNNKEQIRLFIRNEQSSPIVLGT